MSRNVLSLAVRLFADTSGIKLTPVERALQGLSRETEKVAAVFDKFGGASEVANRAQEETTRQIEELTRQRLAGEVSAQQFLQGFLDIKAAADAQAASIEAANTINEKYTTNLDVFVARQEELSQLLSSGLGIDAYNEEIEKAAQGLTDAERAAAGLGPSFAELEEDTSDITALFAELTDRSSAASEAAERYAEVLETLAQQRRDETISAEEYSEAVERARVAAGEEADAIEAAADINDKYISTLDKFLARQEELSQLLGSGIGIEAFNAEVEKAAEGLTDAERAVVGLGPSFAELEDDVSDITALFDDLAERSELAAAEQESFGQALETLAQQRRDEIISAEEYTAAVEEVRAAAERQSEAIKEGIEITEKNRTAAERAVDTIEELSEALNAGTVSYETFQRAVGAATQNLSALDRAAVSEATGITELGNGVEQTGFRFNELSGILGLLPGPFGAIAARVSSLSSAYNGLSRALRNPAATLQSLRDQITGLLNPTSLWIAGLVGAAAAARALQQALQQLAERAERLGNLADQLGVSFQFVQVLETAANRAGISVGTLRTSFGRLQATLNGVDEESKKATQALEKLGLAASDVAGLSEEERIKLIGERIGAIENPAERSAAALALFGRQGIALLPFFKNLAGAADDIERYGRSLTDLDKANLEGFKGSINALKTASEGLGNALTLPFVGLGDGIARAAAEVTAGLTAIIDPIGQFFSPIFDQLGRLIEALGVGLGTLGRIVGAVLQPIATVVQGIYQAVEPLYELILDFQRGFNDASVAVTEWLVAFTPVGVVADNLNLITEPLQRLVNIIITLAQRVREFAGSITEVSERTTALQTVFGFVIDFATVLRDLFLEVLKTINRIADNLLSWAEYFLGVERVTESVGQVGEEARKVSPELEKAFKSGNAAIDSAIDKASQFGQAGFDAALQVQESIRELEALAREGLLSAEEYERAVKNVTKEYDEQLKRVKEVQNIVDRSLEALEIEESFDGDSGRFQAAQRVKVIEEEIARIEEEANLAAQAGDRDRVNELTRRLAQLDQVKERENDIASGAKKEREEEEKRALKAQEIANRAISSGTESVIRLNEAIGDRIRNAGIDFAFELENAQRQFDAGFLSREQLAARTAALETFYEKQAAAQAELADNFRAEQFAAQAEFQAQIEEARRKFEAGILNEEAYNQEVKRQQDLYSQRQRLSAQVLDAENKILERQFDIERQRAEELSQIKSGAIKIGDIRDSAGASAFFDALKEDPAVEEARKQTRELQAMRRDIQKLEAKKADILGGTG